MKTIFKLIWYYIETRYTKLLSLFGVTKDSSVIPEGKYCYVSDRERNTNDPHPNGGIWVKTCKYHRGTKRTGGIACTYTGHFGFDMCLYDQCKICGVNDGLEEIDIF